MKIAVSSQGAEPDSAVDRSFGRAKYFLIHDTESDAFEAMANTQNLNAVQGAGIQSARNVADRQAEAVVTGNIGPKAYAALSAEEIAVYIGADGTVRQAVAEFRAGRLQKAQGANVEAHWA